MVKRILSAVIAAFAVGFVAEAQEKNTAELEKRMAVVELSTIYMRQQPDYESALETQELMGTVVEIVGEQGYWREIVSPQPYRAWATEKGLVEMTEEELKAYEDAPKVMFTGLYGHIYMEPSFKASTLCDLVGGDLLRLAEYAESGDGKGDGAEAVLQDNRIKLKGKWTEVMLPSGRKGHVPTKELKPHYGFMSIAQGEGDAGSIDAQTTEAIIAQAEKLLGSPYLWGGMSAKGVDCSGLVRISHIMNGILLPRNASQQINCGDRVPMPVNPRFRDDRSDAQAFKEEMLARVQNLRRGDLVFFGTPASEPGKKPRITHVGIYLGEGRIIHSSHMVRFNSLIPGEADYYENAHRLIAAIRL
ncbi:MAG: C40 family peptidase [Bacteroidales bacterium]|nr:C40 family peptidase [Bacteroidales bacterium]